MTSPDSSLTLESLCTSMEEGPGSSRRGPQLQEEEVKNHGGRGSGSSLKGVGSNSSSSRRRARAAGDSGTQEEVGGGEEGGGEGAPLMWDSFGTRFQEVQALLDQNRVLIAQVNENHQSKLPDNLTKNVTLIREINLNISKVVSLYSDLSFHFSTQFDVRRQRRSSGDGSGARLLHRPKKP